ncbi:hypothetical protein [Galbitalea soli]|uniref:Asp23/Gls24 family envelope stress response protein n=1 Tax=Galbitalea soli TaxID=1268042 RepID=A0A7C9TQQ5_9MICO|nr:hypothetical protein [Galbitalea soli]NEM91616.1 hypothetical protein [Galbitalea soli]NYJ30310.1 hypothetical protein [Galbitalea soli]
MSADHDELALRLDEVVGEVEGVEAVFSADPTIVRSVRSLASGPERIALVRVVEDSEGLRILASVGVSDDRQAPLTARRVSDAIRAAVGGHPIAEVHVRVGRVAH